MFFIRVLYNVVSGIITRIKDLIDFEDSSSFEKVLNNGFLYNNVGIYNKN